MARRRNDFDDTFVPQVGGEPRRGRHPAGKKPCGRHPHNRLTDVVARQAAPGRHADGNGLYLFVRDTGSRHWVQRITIHGRRRELGLGPYPVVSLANARDVALDNRRTVRDGGDPAPEAERKTGPTFGRVYETVTEIRRKNWDTTTTEAYWRRGFEKHVLPVIGPKPVAAVTLDDVRGIVLPLWGGRKQYRLHTAAEHRVRPALCGRREAQGRQSGC